MDELVLCVPADVLASCSACLLRESATACRRPLRGQNLAWFLTHVHVPLFDFSAWTDEGAGGGSPYSPMDGERNTRGGEGKGSDEDVTMTSRPHVTRGGKGKGKNLATGALLPYKLKVGKGISLYGEKGKKGKSNCWSCSNIAEFEVK